MGKCTLGTVQGNWNYGSVYLLLLFLIFDISEFFFCKKLTYFVLVWKLCCLNNFFLVLLTVFKICYDELSCQQKSCYTWKQLTELYECHTLPKKYSKSLRNWKGNAKDVGQEEDRERSRVHLNQVIPSSSWGMKNLANKMDKPVALMRTQQKC